MAGNCLFRAKFWGFFAGGELESDFNISFYNHKKAHPCAIPRLLSHCASKSVHGSLLYVGPRKKIKKVTQKLYFTPLPGSPPLTDFFTKFGTNVPLVDIINPDKLCVNLLSGFDFTGVKVSIFQTPKNFLPWQMIALNN